MEAVAPVRIVIFAKAPVAGAVKTRLIPVLGADGAARLAERMLADTAAAAVAADLGEPEVCAAPHPEAPEWEPFRPSGARMTDQGEGDLGQRLARAAARVIGAGEGVLLVGTDCPDLDAARLRAAAAQLRTHDAMIHPAVDGGYVLLGLARFHPSLFAGIAWSTGSVAADTIARVRALGWTLHVGETLRDIDEPADLQALGAPHASD
jgi:hypothetical protein